MAGTSILAFWLVALALIAVPGADWAFTLSAGVGRRAVVPAVAGLAIGYVGVTAVVAAGVGAMVAGSPAALTGVTVAGGAYLIWHGVATFAAAPSAVAPPVPPVDGPGHRRLLLRGIGVSGLNPKGLLIFVALLPQFTNPHRAWPEACQIAVLGLVFTATCAAFYLGLGAVALRLLRSRPAATRLISRISGTAMLLIGAGLVLERVIG
jgi:threonine/homoserine/homoserine lactone efflux protein